MSLYWGNKKVSLYLGDKRVRLSIGPAGGLPAGYTELEYIESTGTQYIIHPYIVNNKTSVLCRYAQIANGTELASAIFGVTTNPSVSIANYGCLRLLSGAGAFNRVGWGDNTNNSIIDISGYNTLGQWYNVFYDLNKLYIDNTLVATSATPVSKVWQAQYGLGLFARNGSSITMKSKARISSFQAKEDGILKVNLIPAIRNSDGEVGMFDTVSQTFFTNAGTGEFVMGPATNNLFTTEGSVQDKAISANGAIIDAVYSGFSFAYTNYIKVKPNTTYTITGISKTSTSTNRRVSTYTANKTFISGAIGLFFPANSVGKRYTTTFTTSADTEYVIINYIYTEDEQIQLVEGDVNFGSGVTAQTLSLMSMDSMALASINEPEENLEQE